MALGPWSRVETAAEPDISEADPVTTQPVCESCAAVLSYRPGSTSLQCNYCGHETHIAEPDIAIVERPFHEGTGGGADVMEDMPAVTCRQCAAVFTFDRTEHAGDCPFCGHAVVTDPANHQRISPAALLPFAIDEKSARDKLRPWMKGLWFAPSSLQRLGRVAGALHGVYLPYWTFDSDTTTTYSGQRGTIYYEPRQVTVTVNGRQQTRTQMVQKIRWRPAHGRTARQFDDVLVPASATLPDWLLGKLEPWDLDDLRPYTNLYLTGFQSERYSISLEKGFDHAVERMRQRITADVRMAIGGDAQRIQRMDIQHHRRTFKHILLPVWLGAMRYRDKTYRVCVNARTGRVHGERPWSIVKITLAILIAVVIGGTLFAFAQTSGSL